MTELIYLNDVKRMSNTVLTVGTFDGVHEGHRHLISKVVDEAKKRDARSLIVSFDPHPREIINSGSNGIKLLTTIDERREILSELHVDTLLIIPFNRDFSLLTSEQFIRDVIWNKIGVSKFIIGYDHQFGRNREGSIETVRNIGKELDFDVDIVEAHEVEHITVSSTSVRRALEKEGNVSLAKSFLGRPYTLRGMVIHGAKRGRDIGFPTANIHPDNHKKIIPANGVYAVEVKVSGVRYQGMMNIGVRPTFERKMEKHLEVNIFEFGEEIYGQNIQLYFLKRIRDEKKFQSVDELKQQLTKDKRDCLELK